MVRLLPKIEDMMLWPFASAKPPSCVLPVTSFEIAIVIPLTINKEPRVIIKDGKPLFTTVIPLQ